jgi:hypothetical protein
MPYLLFKNSFTFVNMNVGPHCFKKLFQSYPIVVVQHMRIPVRNRSI